MKYFILIILCVLSFFLGYIVKENDVVTEYKEKTIKEVKVDTILKYYPAPYLVSIKDTIHVKDTILITEVKEYRDTLYQLKISGINPNLDEIKIFNRGIYTTRIVEKQKKWGIGATFGYGISKDGLTPALVLGLSYNIW